MRLLAVLIHTSGSSKPPTVRGTPIHCTRSTTGSKTASDSHWSHRRKGSAIVAVARKTHARTVQLKMVPKYIALIPRSTAAGVRP